VVYDTMTVRDNLRSLLLRNRGGRMRPMLPEPCADRGHDRQWKTMLNRKRRAGLTGGCQQEKSALGRGMVRETVNALLFLTNR